MADDETRQETTRVLAEHRQVSDLLTLIQELAAGAAGSDSVPELFERAFGTLFLCVPFDVAAAVMLEQNLDLYVSTRSGAEHLLNDTFVGTMRERLGELIPVSFESTDVVVRAESHALPPQDGGGIEFDMSALLEQGRRTEGMFLVCRGQEKFGWREREILAIFATQVSLLLDMIRAREEIANLADTDDLTGIWNRRYFRRQLPQEIERARTFNVPLSMILFDIDDFKQINDGFGHVIGDVVLSEMCGVVRETLRPADTLSRYGGDEFAIILPHTDLVRARTVAERLLARLASLTIPTDEEGAIRCSVSIGIAELSPDDATAGDLVRRADEQLYHAKRAGKNRYSAQGD